MHGLGTISRVGTGTVLAATLITAPFAGSARATVTAAPNGEAGKPAAAVLADSVKALAKVKTVKIAASIKDGKQTLRFSLTYVNGVGAAGSFTEGAAAADIIRIGKVLYFRGNTALLGGTAVAATGGRYVRLSATSGDGKELGSFTDLRTFGGELLKAAHLSGTVGSARVGSTPALVLTDSDHTRIYVSATGSPLPLKAVGPAKDPGLVTFSRYNAKVTLKAPAVSTTLPF